MNVVRCGFILRQAQDEVREKALDASGIVFALPPPLIHPHAGEGNEVPHQVRDGLKGDACDVHQPAGVPGSGAKQPTAAQKKLSVATNGGA